MSVFAGVARFDGLPPEQRIVERVSRAVSSQRPGPATIRSCGGAVFGPTAWRRDAIQVETLVGRTGRSLLTAAAILDNRSEIASLLGVDIAHTATSDPALILQMFERYGDTGIAGLHGAFAFAHWNDDTRTLTLGRDCLGRASLFYHIAPDRVVFATTFNGLFALPDVPRELDEVALADFLVLNTPSGAQTFYRGIERVPTRGLVKINRRGATWRHYWSPDFDAPPPFRREEDYVERARELFDQAVAASLRSYPDAAIALSGGLDSSAIAATAARLQTGKTIPCYSVVPPDDATFELYYPRYRSERDKVEALARLYPGLKVDFMAATPDDPGLFDERPFFARFGTPIRGPANRAWFERLLGTAAAKGHRGLIGGRSGNMGFSWAGWFSLTSLLGSGEFAQFAKELFATARQSRQSALRVFARDVVQQAAPVFLQRLITRLRGRSPFEVAWFSAVNPQFVADTGLVTKWRREGFDPWFVARGRSGPRYRAHALFDAHQQARDRGLPVAADDLAMLDPHGDRRLLEFLLAVPEPMYRKNGVPRSFARRVFADRLPPEIHTERRNGEQAVTWFRALNARRADVVQDIERIEASPLASRLIDLPRLKRLLDQWPEDEQAAEFRRHEYKLALARGVHVGHFIRWVEGGNS